MACVAVTPDRAPDHGGARSRVSELHVATLRRGCVVVFALAGQLDSYTVDVLRDAASRYRPDDHPVVIDLSGVDFVDSAGVAALAALWHEAGRANRRIVLVSDRDAIREILHLAGMDGAFDHAPDVPSACRVALGVIPTPSG